VDDQTNSITFSKVGIMGGTEASTGTVLTGTGGTAAFSGTDGDALYLLANSSLATAGEGAATFDLTSFSGAGAWTASGTASAGGEPGTPSAVKILSSANGATISVNAGADNWTATVLTASSGTPTIAQSKGENNNLTIGENITIDLKGAISSATTVGAISLEEDTTQAQGGKLTFAAATSIIKVGNESNAETALAAVGGAFVTSGATTKITVSSFENVKIYPGATTADKVNTIMGGTAEGSLQAFGGVSGEGVVTINADTAATD
jgi:hypothetical protein